jgi:hypothetical protein
MPSLAPEQESKREKEREREMKDAPGKMAERP